MRRSRISALAAAGLLVLAACGTAQDAGSAGGHNQADITFATDMIPHHRQAIEMADLAEGRALDERVRSLAADIKLAQGPEIETMTGWLTSWGVDVPHGAMQGMDHAAGMMADDEMEDLEAASGAEFDQMFLTMMIEHHEGAIAMAQLELSNGEFPEAIAMAEAIVANQTEEIRTMRALLRP